MSNVFTYRIALWSFRHPLSCRIASENGRPCHVEPCVTLYVRLAEVRGAVCVVFDHSVLE